MMPMNIELRMEELVLHGFAPGDRYRIAEAVEAELMRLFTEQGIPQSLSNGGEIERMDGGTFEMTHSSKPEVVGAQVARAVYGGKIK